MLMTCSACYGCLAPGTSTTVLFLIMLVLMMLESCVSAHILVLLPLEEDIFDDFVIHDS